MVEAFEGWTLRHTVARIVRAIRSGLPRTRWELGFDALVLVFVTLMVGLSTVRYWTFQTRGWDLGVYLQAYSVIARGGALPLVPHFTPFAWLLAPLLLAFPAATTLFAVQAAALGGSGFVVYWLVRASTGREDAAFVMGAAYLFGVMPVSIGWFDYHTEALLPLFFLAVLYARQRSHRTGFIVASLLALSVEEFSVLLLLAVGAAFLLSSWLSRKSPEADRVRDRALGRLAVVLATLWALGAAAIVWAASRFSGSSNVLFAGTSGPGGFGAPSLSALPYVLASEVGHIAPDLLMDGSSKLLYLVLVFGAFGFLSFAGDLAELLPAALWFAYALGGVSPARYTFGDQFVAYALPFVAASACSGVGRVTRYFERRVETEAAARPRRTSPFHHPRGRAARAGPVALWVVGMVAVSGLCYPLLESPLQGAPAVSFGFPEPTPHQQVLRDIIGLIPRDATVLTTNDLFSQIATDPNALLSPISPATIRGTTLRSYVAEEVSVASYVLLDFTMDWTNSALVQYYGNWTDFHVVAAGDGIRLLARGPATSPVRWFGGETYLFPPSDFTPGQARLDSTADGSPLLYQGTQRTTGFLWTGPYFPLLAPGQYELTAQFAVTLPEPTTAFELKVLDDPFSLGMQLTPIGGGYSTVSYAFSSDASNQSVLSDVFVNGSAGLHNLTETVTVAWTSIGALEFVGLNPSIGQTIAFYGVTVVDESPWP